MAGLDLDKLTRAVNIHWEEGGDAVFVAAGVNEIILRASINKKDIEKRQGQPENQKKPVFEVIDIPADFHGETQYGGAFGGSYRNVKQGLDAKPTFVLAGGDASEDHTWGIIMYSRDGREWKRAGKLETGAYEFNDASFLALVWDNGFYGYAFSDEYYFPPPDSRTEVNTYDVVMSSNDGTNFGEVGRNLRYNSEESAGPNLERPAAFEERFNNPAKLPDGTFGYYEKRDDRNQIVESFLAVPKTPSHYWLKYTNTPEEASKDVEITILKDKTETKKTETTPIYVNGIAYVDEMLMVGGRTDADQAAIACSIDQGKTWEIVWRADQDHMQEIWVIMGAPLSDIEQTTA